MTIQAFCERSRVDEVEKATRNMRDLQEQLADIRKLCSMPMCAPDRNTLTESGAPVRHYPMLACRVGSSRSTRCVRGTGAFGSWFQTADVGGTFWRNQLCEFG